METPVTFKSEGEQIVGMLHVPGRRKGKCPAVVLFHGFTGNKVEAHRLFVKMARALTGTGFVVLRFDFRGCGDSAGDFSTMTISSELADARNALKFLRARPEVDRKRMGVLGFSVGGLIAAMLLGEDIALRAGALWAPVADLREQIKRKVTPEAKKQLREIGCVDYGGFAVGQEFFKDLAYDPVRAITNTMATILLVHGTNDETVAPAAANKYMRALKKAGKTVVKHMISSADHTFAALPWETQLIGLTLDWFRCNLT